MYDLIPHASRPTTDPSRPTIEPPPDGILGLVQTKLAAKPSKKQTATTSNQQVPPAKTASSPIASAEINVVQSTKP